MQQHQDELLTVREATNEAVGQISYQQLLRGIKAGRINAIQPSGERGHYRIPRSELKRLLLPVRRTQ